MEMLVSETVYCGRLRLHPGLIEKITLSLCMSHSHETGFTCSRGPFLCFTTPESISEVTLARIPCDVVARNIARSNY
jgi:hypothetical protein